LDLKLKNHKVITRRHWQVFTRQLAAFPTSIWVNIGLSWNPRDLSKINDLSEKILPNENILKVFIVQSCAGATDVPFAI
jgi:DNA-binding Lrp family transcriptional regulator